MSDFLRIFEFVKTLVDSYIPFMALPVIFVMLGGLLRIIANGGVSATYEEPPNYRHVRHVPEPEPEPEPEAEPVIWRGKEPQKGWKERRLCAFCGGLFLYDKRGNCKACGAPRR